MKRLFIYLILVFGLFSCEKDTKKEPQIIFEGITERDDYGSPIGYIDLTDWQIGDSWIDSEKQLFQDFHSYDYVNSNEANIEITAYPNPFHGVLNLNLSKKNTTRFDFRIVTTEFKV